MLSIMSCLGRYKYKIGTLGNPTTTDPCKGLLVRIGDPPIPLSKCYPPQLLGCSGGA
jgi:hypothetical protein